MKYFQTQKKGTFMIDTVLKESKMVAHLEGILMTYSDHFLASVAAGRRIRDPKR